MAPRGRACDRAWTYSGGRGFGVSAVDGPSPGDVLAKAMEATIAAATAPTPGGAAPPAVTVIISVVRGDPAWKLPAAAGEGDLLVVGSRGHGTAVGLLFGSVSLHVVSRARCPVVVEPNLVHSRRTRRHDQHQGNVRRNLRHRGKDHASARELWHAGTFVFFGGAAVSVSTFNCKLRGRADRR
jgi:nucleotide-binding universal stress UspA family protein